MVRIKFAEDFQEQPALIRIAGVGGAGGNAVNRMIEAAVGGVEFITANTDAQALRRSLSPVKLQIGEKLTKGLGVGGNPVLGRQAAEESRDRIREVLSGADMVFVTAGMGGGTGTGASPIVAEAAKSVPNPPLLVGVVSRPFEFEGMVRHAQAEAGIRELRNFVDTLIVIPNDRLFDIIDEKTTSIEAFRVADDVLRHAVQAITDIITSHGMINVDFADVRTVMSGAGEALMGMGQASGKSRALSAARQAILSPLLENVSIEGAKGVLVNITANRDITMFEIREAMDFIRSAVSQEAHVFYGQVYDDGIEDRVKVTIIATGFPQKRRVPGNVRTHSSTAKPSLVETANRPPVNPTKRKPDDIYSGVSKQVDMEELQRPAYLRRPSRKLK